MHPGERFARLQKPKPAKGKPVKVKSKVKPVKLKAKPIKLKAKPVKPRVKAKPVKLKAKPVKLKAKPVKLKAKPVKPRVKAKPVKLKAKPVKPKVEPVTTPKPPKTPIARIFGKRRKQLLRPLTSEDIDRIAETEQAIREVREYTDANHERFGPSELSPLGYEWHELIAAVEKMTPHDVYTLFMSP